MGSAVVKPLARRRGKIKSNESAANSTESNEEENADGDCKPNVNSKADPVKNIRQPFSGKPCKVDSDSAHSIRKVCCSYAFLTGKTNPCDSDEETCPKLIACEVNSNPSQSNHSQQNGDHVFERQHHVIVKSMASPDNKHKKQSADMAVRKGKLVNVSSLNNATSCQKIPSLLKRNCSAKNDRSAKKQADGENKFLVGASELTEDVNPEDQNVCRDARTPSPEYDDLDDVKIINPNQQTKGPCTPSPPNSFDSTSDTKIVPIASNVSVPVSPAEELLSDTGQQRRETGHGNLKISSPYEEYVEDQYQGAGEPLSVRPNFQEHLYARKPDANVTSTTPKPEVFDCEKEDDMMKDYGFLPHCSKSPRAGGNKSVNATNSFSKLEADLASECNENNAIRNTDSYCDVMKDTILSCSNCSSSTSLNFKGKVMQSDKANDILSLNHPHVEEILAAGEEFMDEIDEGFLPQSLSSDIKKCLNSMQETCSTEHPISSSLRVTGKLGSSRSSLTSVKTNETKDKFVKSGQESDTATSTRKSDSPSILGRTYKCASRPSSVASTCQTPTPNYQATSVLGSTYKCASRPSSVASAHQTPASNYQATSVHGSTYKCTSRPSSAASARQTPTSNYQATSQCKTAGAGQGTRICEIDQKPLAAENIMSRERNLSQPGSSKESLHKPSATKIQSTPSVNGQTPTILSRQTTPRAETGETVCRASDTRVNSRPPSVKQSHQSISEEKPFRSGRLSVSTVDSAHDSDRPQSVRSRQSSIISQPKSGIDRQQLSMEYPPDIRQEVILVTPIVVRSKSSHLGSDESASFVAGGKESASVKDINSAMVKSPRTAEPPALVVIAATKLSPTFPEKADCSDQVLGEALCTEESKTYREPSYLPAIYATHAQTVKSVSRSTVSPILKASGEQQDESLQKSSAVPDDTIIPHQSSRSPRADCRAGSTSSSQIARIDEDPPAESVNAPSSSLDSQTNFLSPDRIDNIRKQLYEEGLKPAEREGGVAFFIPVTEDGLQTQADGATVTERLTKTKKSSLNYEERMILANINRQVQLSKKKEFAVRDIRNVRGAASGSDGSDRTKHSDDVDDFDSSF